MATPRRATRACDRALSPTPARRSDIAYTGRSGEIKGREERKRTNTENNSYTRHRRNPTQEYAVTLPTEPVPSDYDQIHTYTSAVFAFRSASPARALRDRHEAAHERENLRRARVSRRAR